MIRYDLTGERFGMLKVLEYAGAHEKGGSLWLCQCDCGNRVVIRTHYLTQYGKSSCGCAQFVKKHNRGVTHIENSTEAIREINRLATAAGVSYGQYVGGRYDKV